MIKQSPRTSYAPQSIINNLAPYCCIHFVCYPSQLYECVNVHRTTVKPVPKIYFSCTLLFIARLSIDYFQGQCMFGQQIFHTICYTDLYYLVLLKYVLCMLLYSFSIIIADGPRPKLFEKLFCLSTKKKKTAI